MKPRLSEWASIAEIIGTVAVVVSLLFVVRSVDQNTRVIESAEASKIWDAWRSVAVLPVMTDGELATIAAKVASSESLSAAEKLQWNRYLAAQIDVWAQLYDSYAHGLIGSDYWAYWNSGFWRLWVENGYNDIFQSRRDFYDPSFRNYIDQQLAERSEIQ